MEPTRDKTDKGKSAKNPMAFILMIILVSYGLFFYFQIGFEYRMKENLLRSSYEQQLKDSSEIAIAVQSRLDFVSSILRDASRIEVVVADKDSIALLLEGVQARLQIPDSIVFLVVDSQIVDSRGPAAGLSQTLADGGTEAPELFLSDEGNALTAISSTVIDGTTLMTVAYPAADEGTYLAVAFPPSQVLSDSAETYSAYLTDVNWVQKVALNGLAEESEIPEGIADSLVAAPVDDATDTPNEVQDPLIYDGDQGELMITGSSVRVLGSDYAVLVASSVDQHLMGIGETLFAQRIQTFSLLAGTSLITIILALFLSKNVRLDREVKARTGELEQSNQLIGRQKRELELANSQLKQLDVMKDQFISVASHELRNPIQPILMYTELAKRGNVSPEKALEGIAVEARRLKKLANDILDVSMIESGGLKYNFEHVRLRPLIDDVANSAQISAPEGIKVEVLMENDALRIDLDALRIAEVLQNIISNAIKFTTKGYIRISVREDSTSGMITIQISDSGGGIPVEILPTIFDKFATSPVGDKNKHGTGLGLYISNAIVIAHGGKIVAANKPGGGAVFTITLPLASGHHQPSADPAVSDPASPSSIADAN